MLKVIIADDEKLICRLVQTLADWEALGMQVAGTAENGLEALELIRTLEPDILITDIRMPGCDGLELIEQAKKISPQLEVVIISGYAHFEYAQTAIRFGVGNYLLKPIKQTELMDTLKSIGEKIEKTEGFLQAEQNNRQAVALLRKSLLKDMLSPHFRQLTSETLKKEYYINIEAGLLQIFLIKIDETLSAKVSLSAEELLQEKVRKLLLTSMQEYCTETLLYFHMGTGYGLLQYCGKQKDAVRKKLRDCLNELNARRDLYGTVEFSIALGRTVHCAKDLSLSLQDAAAAAAERLVEGVGRILEDVPEKSGIAIDAKVQEYGRQIDQVIALNDENLLKQAVAELKRKTVSTQKLCGREALELVEKAGILFISRITNENERLCFEFEKECERCGSINELFSELFFMQKKLMKETAERKSSEATKPIRLAKQYVKQHFGEPVTLEEICEKTGFSVSYFSALFKKETGEGFLKYLTKVRMDEAKAMLRETDLPISEICENVGYTDRKHFTHTFRKATGLNPAEYRKIYG
ncbi:MAG TPA: response regulator [Lachnospiraceae bacterium]|nr:response regulator [Lachnospiraceae bacterium]